MEYEIIVVGAGHAGCEAALASARKNHKTLLITGNKKNIADTPCNPSIGGPAKGIVVREIDALGGEMGKNTDKSLLQIKLLNTRKGPAVQALRAQIDKIEYPKNMISTLENTKNLTIKEGMVEQLMVKDEKVQGVILKDGTSIKSKAVILTTGTYLKGSILIGDKKTIGGPHGEEASLFLSDHLKELGFRIQRLKTGTPPRIERSSIDFSNMLVQPGDQDYRYFSNEKKSYYKIEDQMDCYLIYTNATTHKIIEDNLDKSSMYSGLIEGIGPRYCPSIETKIVRFHDKDRHQLFLEPESRSYDDIYLQGFSTSMPEEIQEKMVHSLPGLENAKIKKYAYAIEYDAIDPLQLKQTLETKVIENLYTAGQINGTSGYEEAACQGLIAGINASLKLENKEPLILKRNESYIGVLIDDLVTKGTKEPYRLLTSRAEYRLLLRNDNADIRLMKYGYQVGLINKERYQKLINKQNKIEDAIKKLKAKIITPKEKDNNYLKSINIDPIKDPITLYDFLKRQDINLEIIKNWLTLDLEEDEKEELETIIKYDGYIKKEEKEAQKMLEYEEVIIPNTINYKKITNLKTEAIEKLEMIRPTSIGQAMRISGVSPADISILMIALKRGNQ